MSKELKGFKMEDTLFESQMAYCLQRIKENPELRIHYDLESGYPSVVTQELADDFDKLWEACKPKLSDKIRNVGQIWVFGTSNKI